MEELFAYFFEIYIEFGYKNPLISTTFVGPMGPVGPVELPGKFVHIFCGRIEGREIALKIAGKKDSHDLIFDSGMTSLLELEKKVENQDLAS